MAQERPSVQDQLIADVEARKAVGLATYGTLLYPHNGRDALRDAYEEAIDLALYLRQAMLERDEAHTALEPNGGLALPLSAIRRIRLAQSAPVTLEERAVLDAIDGCCKFSLQEIPERYPSLRELADAALAVREARAAKREGR